MPDPATTHEVFSASLERCLRSEDFIPTFYARFMATSHEVREKFRNTDFKQQNAMLAQSLRLAAGATQADPKSTHELKCRAESHDRHHLNIAPHLYDYWLVAIIQAAYEFDREFNAEIEDTWRQVMGHVIDEMKSQY